jgi:hypothetical protein
MVRPAFLSAAILSIGSLLAQSPVSGPVEGFLYDPPTKSIRAVTGSLGAATLGPALLESLDFASVAPGKDHAIACHANQCALVSGLGSEQVSTVEIPAFPDAPDGAAWSTNGSVAIVYSLKNNWLQILRGLPAEVNPGVLLSVAPLGGALTIAAADRDGKRIAIGVAGDRSGVYEVTEGQNVAPLMDSPAPSALAFSEDGGTLYALDRETRLITEFDTAGRFAQSWPANGLDDPVAIRPGRFMQGGLVLYVAGGRDRMLAAYDLSSHAPVASFAVGIEPTRIEPLGIDTFLLGSRASDGDPLWTFANRSLPAVYFVPASPLLTAGTLDGRLSGK